MEIPLFKPTIRRRVLDAVLSCLVADTVGPGKVSRELVSTIAAYLGLAGGTAVSSYAASIAHALDLVGVGGGDKVVVSALSPAVYLGVLEARGARVLFADVEPERPVVRSEELQRCLGEGASAALIHHSLGSLADSSPCLDAPIPVIEDISQSLLPHAEDGLFRRGADVYLLSLDSWNFITAGAGGIVLGTKRAHTTRLKEFTDASLETQLLPDMNAALALSQLHDLDGDLARRREIAALFTRSVLRSRHGVLAADGTGGAPAFSFAVRIKDGMPEVRKYAHKRGVDTCPAFELTPVAFRDDVAQQCPEARKLALSCLLFPLYPMLGKSQMELVSRVLSTLP